MTQRKSMLLLGGSKHQIPAIVAAKRHGLRTVLCDYLSDNPGQFEADVFYCKSTTDLDEMLSVATSENVSAVLAYGTDVAAVTAAYVSEKLHLPTNPLESIMILSTKHLFRKHLLENGFNCPQFFEFSKDIEVEELLKHISHMTFPIVIKPTDASGSKGVHIIDAPDIQAIYTAIEDASRFSRNSILIAEEYIQSSFPRVIGGDIFVVDGKVSFWGLMSCFRDKQLGGLVPCGERFPSGLGLHQLQAVKEEVQKLVSSLHLVFGEFNVEIIIGKDDKPYFLELAGRAGGNMIPDQLSDISGKDLVRANVVYALGESCDVDFSGEEDGLYYCTYMVHSHSAGIYKDLVIDDSQAKFLYRRVDYVQLGQQVDSFANSSSALGVLFFKFDNLEQLETFTQNPGQYVQVKLI